MSKGAWRRPASISDAEMDARWAEAFQTEAKLDRNETTMKVHPKEREAAVILCGTTYSGAETLDETIDKVSRKIAGQTRLVELEAELDRLKNANLQRRLDIGKRDELLRRWQETIPPPSDMCPECLSVEMCETCQLYRDTDALLGDDD